VLVLFGSPGRIRTSDQPVNSRCVRVLDLHPMPGAAGAVGRVSVFSPQTFVVILAKIASSFQWEEGAPAGRTRRQSFALAAASLFPVIATALGSGWVSSQSARAAASGSIPVFFHHELSSPQ
jgi:hypothetical protein